MTRKRETNLKKRLMDLFIKYRMTGQLTTKKDSRGLLVMEISANEVPKKGQGT